MAATKGNEKKKTGVGERTEFKRPPAFDKVIPKSEVKTDNTDSSAGNKEERRSSNNSTTAAKTEAKFDDRFGRATVFGVTAEANFKKKYKRKDDDMEISARACYVCEEEKNDRTLIYGVGKSSFSREDMKKNKILTYTAKPGNIIVLLDRRNSGFKRPAHPRDNEWKVSMTFNKDEFDLMELSQFDLRIISKGRDYIHHLKDSDYRVKDGNINIIV